MTGKKCVGLVKIFEILQ